MLRLKINLRVRRVTQVPGHPIPSTGAGAIRRVPLLPSDIRTMRQASSSGPASLEQHITRCASFNAALEYVA